MGHSRSLHPRHVRHVVRVALLIDLIVGNGMKVFESLGHRESLSQSIKDMLHHLFGLDGLAFGLEMHTVVAPVFRVILD